MDRAFDLWHAATCDDFFSSEFWARRYDRDTSLEASVVVELLSDKEDEDIDIFFLQAFAVKRSCLKVCPFFEDVSNMAWCNILDYLPILIVW